MFEATLFSARYLAEAANVVLGSTDIIFTKGLPLKIAGSGGGGIIERSGVHDDS